jgi:prepilin-type N-terminal cleavage/methylation domain-containing protein
MKIKNNSRKGFTLVELLVVIGILAILVVTVIIFINPSQLASQGRDTNRVSDLTSLNQNVALYHETNPAGSLGSSSVYYISIPDPAATSTAGDQCQGLELPSAPSSYTYHCAASSTYRNVNGTGWVPVNFSAISGPSLATLPIDPVNTTSSTEYYVYVASGTQYEFIANPESQKTIASSVSSSFSQGNNLALAAFPATQITFTTSTYGVGTAGGGTMAFDSHTNTIWVADGGYNNIITQVNDTTHATSSYSTPVNPNSVAFDSNTNTVWVTSSAGVTQINDTTYATSTYAMGTSLGAIAFDSHTNTLWVANYANNGSVIQMNDTSPYATSSYSVGAFPSGVVFDPHTNSIWVSNYNDGTVTQINDTTYAASTYSVGSHPEDIAFDSNTNTIWVSEYNGTAVQINDTTYATSSYSVGTSLLFGIAFDPHTNSVWVASAAGITQINDTTYATSTYLASSSSWLVFDSHNNTIWVSQGGSNNTITEFTPSN